MPAMSEGVIEGEGYAISHIDQKDGYVGRAGRLPEGEERFGGSGPPGAVGGGQAADDR
jgi:hypothetical protein